MPKTKETARMRRVNEKYDEFSNMTEEQMKDKLEKLNREIEGTKTGIESVQDEEKKVQLLSKLHSLEKESKLANGFKNNKAKIDKAREYKGKIEEDIKVLVSKKQKIEKEIKKTENGIKKIIKQLNIKDQSTITNEEYNDKQTAKDMLSRDLSKYQSELAQINSQIEAKQMAISKCNMIYSNLMYNETWDKINSKAVRMSYQAKNNKKEQEKKEKQAKEPVEKEENRDIWSSEEAKRAYMAQQEKLKANEKKQENKLIIRNAFRENHPRLAKMMDFFSKAGNKVKNVFKKKEENTTKKSTTTKMEKPEEVDFSGKRDAFVEKFRQSIEKEKKVIGRGNLEEIREISEKRTERNEARLRKEAREKSGAGQEIDD